MPEQVAVSDTEPEPDDVDIRQHRADWPGEPYGGRDLAALEAIENRGRHERVRGHGRHLSRILIGKIAPAAYRLSSAACRL